MRRVQSEAAIPHACMPTLDDLHRQPLRKPCLMLGASLSLALVSLPAQAAQSAAPAPAPPEAQKPAPEQGTEIVVTGKKKPDVVNSIDRTTYDVSRNPQAATGTVSDVLRNIPSVEVDPRGNVSMRGDSNVQILVDGKPSTMFSGGNRAQALQQMSASEVESIEVMTNPSSEFRPDGTGGIINIVTRKIKKAGTSGSVQAGVGTMGRWNLNVLGASNKGPLNLNASLGFRRNPGKGHTESDILRTDTFVDEETTVSERSRHEFATQTVNGSAGLDYDYTSRDRFSIGASVLANKGEPTRITSQTRSNASGTITSSFDRLEALPYTNATTQLTTGWRRSFAEPGRVLSITARGSESHEKNTLKSTYTYSAAPQRIEERPRDSRTTNLSLSVSYTRPLPKDAILKVGYDYQLDGNDQDLQGRLLDALTGASPIPSITNHFVYEQASHQVYSTYQRPFGKFTILAGLRLEQSSIDYDQRTTAIRGASQYFDVHPSMHLQYALSENDKLTFSYSHRVQRPGGDQLNPFVVVQDAFNASSGNPDLKPQEAHSLEAKWQWQKGSRYATATVYGRETYNTIGTVSRYLTPLVVLQTYENRGTSKSGGLEMDGGGKFSPVISYKVNANLSHRELRSSSEDGSRLRSGVSYTARASLDYRPTPLDFVQIMGNYSGRQLTLEGYRKPWGTVNVGYQRKLRPDLLIVLTISDLFDSAQDMQVIETRTISGITRDWGTGRTISFGLTRQLGGRPAKEKQFEFEGE